MRKAKVYIDDDSLHVSSEILRAIAHPLRLRILEFIDNNSDINVNKIYNTLKLGNYLPPNKKRQKKLLFM
jgi:ArsR family transcriptional regulator